MVDDNDVKENKVKAEEEENLHVHVGAKRGASRQITKKDYEDDDEEEESEPVNEGTFKKADKETLAKRKIVKAIRPPPSSSFADSSSNPFANAFASASSESGAAGSSSNGTAAKKSTSTVFGSGAPSGFGALGATKTTGGFSDSGATSTSIFGSGAPSGFGALAGASSATSNGDAAPSSVFGSGAPSGFAAAGVSNGNGGFGSAPKKEPEPAVKLPDHVDLTNGEEGEECVFTIRAKLFELRAEEERKGGEGPPQQPAAPSVPPSSSNAPAAKTDKVSEKKDDKKEEAKQNEEESKPQAVEESKGESKQREGAPAKDEPKNEGKSELDEKIGSAKPKTWHEVGIGPFRVLERSSGRARVVQRQEATPGGPGHRLLLNVSLRKECRVLRKSDKHVQLDTTKPTGEAGSYLIKVGSAEDSQKLQDVLEEKISEAAAQT